MGTQRPQQPRQGCTGSPTRQGHGVLLGTEDELRVLVDAQAEPRPRGSAVRPGDTLRGACGWCHSEDLAASRPVAEEHLAGSSARGPQGPEPPPASACPSRAGRGEGSWPGTGPVSGGVTLVIRGKRRVWEL